MKTLPYVNLEQLMKIYKKKLDTAKYRGLMGEVLKKLKDYKEVITNENPDYLMVFMRIPYSKKTAKEYAAEVATIVREYESY
jgi:phosphoribulokinase